MAVLSIESQVKRQNIKKELFETVGIPYDASFGSPDATKVSDTPSSEKLLFSLGSAAAAADWSKRNQISAMKCSEPETATRRRDPLHQVILHKLLYFYFSNYFTGRIWFPPFNYGVFSTLAP